VAHSAGEANSSAWCPEVKDSLAFSYAVKRRDRGTAPASRSRHEPLFLADTLDCEHLRGAKYMNDGNTIIMRDGSILHRSPQGWVEAK
jgi:hypothetical protein